MSRYASTMIFERVCRTQARMAVHAHSPWRICGALSPGGFGNVSGRPALGLHKQHQVRPYLYLPTTWDELQERCKRWIYDSEQTVVKVQLLRQKEKKRRRLQQQNKRRRQLARVTTQWNIFSSAASAAASQVPLPLPVPSQMRSTSISADNIKSRCLGWKAVGQEHYYGWKQRRKDQYYGWKQRRKDQYYGWKQRRKDQYYGWKQQRKEQYYGWKQRRKDQYIGWKQKGDQAWVRITKRILVDEYSKAEWFDALGRPLTARDNAGRFVNPWRSQSTNGIQSVETILKWRWQRFLKTFQEVGLGSIQSFIPKFSWLNKSVMPPLLKPSPPLPDLSNSNNGNRPLSLTWIGHSTCWIQMNGMTILTDPIFSLRCGPVQWLPIGPCRLLPPSHTLEEVLDSAPGRSIDICCITHDHYDHLDEQSVLQLSSSVKLWVVPLGISEWLQETCNIDGSKIVEMEWWQQLQLRKEPDVEDGSHMSAIGVAEPPSHGSSLSTPKETSSDLIITCCPSSHWASRNMSDRNTRLWCSFAFEAPSTLSLSQQTAQHQHDQQLQEPQKLFVCGDTGYPSFPLFRQIGDALGPFDLAAIPIGAYEPSEMMREAHVNPEEAVLIHKDLRSRQSVAIHWGSFPLSEECLFHDPPKDLQAALLEEEKKEHNPPLAPFDLLDHGETIILSRDSGLDINDNGSKFENDELSDYSDDDDDDAQRAIAS